MQISRAGYAVKYMLPELYEPFELVQIRVLPFSLTDNAQMVRFRLESELVAMNSVGESFLFPGRDLYEGAGFADLRYSGH